MDKLKIAYRWLTAPPPVGLPARHNVARQLCPPQPNILSAAIMRQADRYYAAGCPVDQCEASAARDFMLELYESN